MAEHTEALQRALAEVWSGAELIDAECVEDQLHDLGFEVVQMPRARAASKRRHHEDLPSSTRGLVKKRSGG